jgi:hypothetical protein
MYRLLSAFPSKRKVDPMTRIRLFLSFMVLCGFAQVSSACVCADGIDPATGEFFHPSIKIGVNVQAPAYNDLVRNANVGWIRTAVRWSEVERSKGAFDFSIPEAVVNDARARGLKVLAIVGHPPIWAGSNTNGTTPPSSLTDWQNYMRATAQHFAGRIDAYEIWNEPDLRDSGDGVGWNADHNEVSSRPKYVDLVIHASVLVRQWAPGTRIVAPSMSTRAHDDRPTRTKQVWQQLQNTFYNGQRASTYVDVVSFHNTAISNDAGSTVLFWLRSNINDMVTNAPSLDCKEQWVTEFGYLALYGETLQRDNIENALYTYRGGSAGWCDSWYADTYWLTTRIKQAFIYVLTDATSGATFGIYRSNFTPRPVVTNFLQQLAFPAAY